MPIYEYHCKKCDKKFDSYKTEFLSSEDDKGAECPKCKEMGERIPISETSQPIFKGSGFFATDYKNKR